MPTDEEFQELMGVVEKLKERLDAIEEECEILCNIIFRGQGMDRLDDLIAIDTSEGVWKAKSKLTLVADNDDV